MPFNKLTVVLLVLTVLVIPGCAMLSGDKDEHANWAAKDFYVAAKAALKSGSYDKAIKLYEKLETRFPYGVYATQAQLDIAYAYYKANEPESAIVAAERFIKLHPTNPHVDYAYYLKGLVNYNRGIGFLERFIPTDSSQRDPGAARDAFKDFELLVRKFPNSRYVADAKQRMVALRNNLAMYEIHVARYYMKRKAYLAAANRGVQVIENYQRTPAVPLALTIMEKAYRKMGLGDLADDAARVYALNYSQGIPNYEGLEDRSVGEVIWDFIGLDK